MTDSLQTRFDAALAALPEPLRAPAAGHWADIVPHLAAVAPAAGGIDWVASAPRVLAASDFVARVCARRAERLPELLASGDLARPYRPGELAARASAALAGCIDEATLKRQLRSLREREMLRIAWRDLAGWAELPEVLGELSDLADACIGAAADRLRALYAEPLGRPRAEFVVLGMGKLGGRELNYSSDVDLIFAYSEDGELDGPRALSHHEYFTRLCRGLIAALNDPTEDGIVFRVDMRLRPNGASGPLALSFDAMEHYYQAHGREWERYAMIKARPVAGDAAAGAALMARLQPFVFRKYLDYGAIEEIRRLKTMIERELDRKGIDTNIKLGPGGIREIEFVGQAFQLIRGGRDAELRRRAILPVLARLAVTGDLTPQAVAELTEAYGFLRRTENRLQMADDRQTHSLPGEAEARLRLAVSMGFDDWDGFHARLRRHMRKVHGHFEQVFVAPQGEQPRDESQGLAAVWSQSVDAATAAQRLAAAGYPEPEAALTLLHALRGGSAYGTLSAQGRERLDRLMPLLLGAAGLAQSPQETLGRLVRLIEAIGRRSVYLALLVENPIALSQLVKLCDASAWIADWISQHPVLLDELIDPASLYAPLAPEALDEELAAQLNQVAEDDLEAQMEILREFRHGHVLRVAAADVGPGLAPERVGRHLSDIAAAVLRQAVAIAGAAMQRRHGRPACGVEGRISHPGFAVVAYGKLGSGELGYGSDLDIVFLHDPCAGEGESDGARPLPNEVYFARLGQRIIHILTTRTRGGVLYEVDMRLRPSGRAGALVTTLPAFREYQQSQAWTWEHQALVRARAVAGDAALCAGFEAARDEILRRPRDPDKLREDVVAMRERTRAAKAAADSARFDLKQDPGGMIDIEFMVQYWVLRWASAHPDLTGLRDNVSLLAALGGKGLVEAGRARELADAYRRYLSIEHRLKLMERRALVDPAELGDAPARVAAAWKNVFE
jgi:glutamate-ammonia-ligase adenylyltransferase